MNRKKTIDKAALRRGLGTILNSDAKLRRFLVDYLSEMNSRFAPGTDNSNVINAILSELPSDVIIEKIHKYVNDKKDADDGHIDIEHLKNLLQGANHVSLVGFKKNSGPMIMLFIFSLILLFGDTRAWRTGIRLRIITFLNDEPKTFLNSAIEQWNAKRYEDSRDNATCVLLSNLSTNEQKTIAKIIIDRISEVTTQAQRERNNKNLKDSISEGKIDPSMSQFLKNRDDCASTEFESPVTTKQKTDSRAGELLDAARIVDKNIPDAGASDLGTPPIPHVSMPASYALNLDVPSHNIPGLFDSKMFDLQYPLLGGSRVIPKEPNTKSRGKGGKRAGLLVPYEWQFLPSVNLPGISGAVKAGPLKVDQPVNSSSANASQDAPAPTNAPDINDPKLQSAEKDIKACFKNSESLLTGAIDVIILVHDRKAVNVDIVESVIDSERKILADHAVRKCVENVLMSVEYYQANKYYRRTYKVN